MSISKRTPARTKIEDAFDGDAAKGQRFGEFAVGHSEAGHVGTNPLRKNIHRVCDLPELLQKSHIPGVELANISDTVLHHGNPLHTHAEGEAADFFRVIGRLLPRGEGEHRGIDHAAAQQLDPSRLFALAAAPAAGEDATDLHIGRRLGEGKNEGKNRVLTLDPKNAFMAWSSVPLRSEKVMLVSTQSPSTWWKMGEWVGVDDIVSVHLAGDNNTQRWWLLFHGVDLYRRGMGVHQQPFAQRLPLLVHDHQGVLGIARRMARREISDSKL